MNGENGDSKHFVQRDTHLAQGQPPANPPLKPITAYPMWATGTFPADMD